MVEDLFKDIKKRFKIFCFLINKLVGEGFDAAAL